VREAESPRHPEDDQKRPEVAEQQMLDHVGREPAVDRGDVRPERDDRSQE